MSDKQHEKPLSAEEEAFFSCLDEDPTTLPGQQAFNPDKGDEHEHAASASYFADESRLNPQERNAPPQADLSAENAGQGRMLLVVAVLALLAVGAYIAVA